MQKWIVENYANLVCRFSNNNFPIFLFKLINAALLFSSIFNICFIFIESKFVLLYLISYLNLHIAILATKRRQIVLLLWYVYHTNNIPNSFSDRTIDKIYPSDLDSQVIAVNVRC